MPSLLPSVASSHPTIRPFAPSDLPRLQQLVAEMQDYERGIDGRLRTGASITEAYTEAIRARCRAERGAVLLAELGGEVVGFLAVVADAAYEALDEPPGCYALVTDLGVTPTQRGRGIGRALIGAAEDHARAHGADELRIAVLAGNAPAAHLYRSAGFRPYLVVLDKRLERPVEAPKAS